jgi:hypothetical protein
VKRLISALVIGAILALLALLPAAAADTITIQLGVLNNSGESGTATLTDLGNNQTRVVLSLTGAPSGVAQPAHIHNGTCATLDPNPRYPLTNVQNGQSETTVNASLASIMNGNMAINVHKSPQEAAIYVSCGNIPATAAGQVMPGTGHAVSGALAPVVGGLAVLAASGMIGGMLLRRRGAR